MALERTLSILKPDAVEKNIIGEILSRIERAGLKIVAAKMLYLSQLQAEAFYDEHSNKSFFPGLVEFTTSGPIMVLVLEGDNAILRHREMMGATNPADAAPGTIRAEFADSITRNIMHGSDTEKAAQREVAFFFSDGEIYSR